MSAIELKIATIKDESKADFLAEMINTVYNESEGNIWVDGYKRTSKGQIINIIRDNELLLAQKEDEIYGCVHLERVNDTVFKFKMLVANPIFKGEGIGSLLVKYAEQQAKEQGGTTMQLELLVPTAFKHPEKVFLHKWYSRIGYELIAEHSVDYVHQGISSYLKTDCVAKVYQKDLF
jgi:N-acetylglutamate synthase-like GNAT family acetyltransferase